MMKNTGSRDRRRDVTGGQETPTVLSRRRRPPGDPPGDGRPSSTWNSTSASALRLSVYQLTRRGTRPSSRRGSYAYSVCHCRLVKAIKQNCWEYFIRIFMQWSNNSETSGYSWEWITCTNQSIDIKWLLLKIKKKLSLRHTLTRNVLGCDQSNYSSRIIFSYTFTLEPTTNWIGWTISEIWPFKIIQDS